MLIKGVNLGNWLVLEKWMSPQLFEGTDADDEYWLPRLLSPEKYRARIATHRAEYITERDFITIKSWGLNSVRIPVPYFIFGDREPFIGCISELDKAFNWAEKYGLSILIDLHTAPGGQNGFDNGGISGVCTWGQDADEVEFIHTVLERLAKRYGFRPGLLGIQPINEPLLDTMWENFNIEERYKARDPEMAKNNAPIDVKFLKEFYIEVYDRVKTLLDKDKYIVLHDGFDLSLWNDFMPESDYENIIIDTHQYLMLAEMLGCEQSIKGYQKYIKENYFKLIEDMKKYHKVICAEWCLFNSLACGVDTHGGKSVVTGLDASGASQISAKDKEEIYSSVASAQINAWNNGNGYYYWSYKLLIDTVNDKGWEGWDSWDMGRCIDMGWLPKEIL